MPRRRLPYKEGDWFAVPLLDNEYALGLVARMNRRGVVLGYFFGPRYQSPPSLAETMHRRPEDAILIAQFGDLDLLNGKWPIIGSSPEWQRDRWPIPVFARFDLTNPKRAWRAYYDDSLGLPVTEEAVTADEVRSLPRDGLLGAGALAKHLTRLLAE